MPRYPQFDQTTDPREITKTSSLKSCDPCFVGFPVEIPLHSVMIVGASFAYPFFKFYV